MFFQFSSTPRLSTDDQRLSLLPLGVCSLAKLFHARSECHKYPLHGGMGCLGFDIARTKEEARIKRSSCFVCGEEWSSVWMTVRRKSLHLHRKVTSLSGALREQHGTRAKPNLLMRYGGRNVSVPTDEQIPVDRGELAANPPTAVPAKITFPAILRARNRVVPSRLRRVAALRIAKDDANPATCVTDSIKRSYLA
ncbi:hypothetical protein AVEN_115731-1 [Araneus ventricosus]|uniref:Uncharacterized protein n=1 Tax=Araneus ventricosus TaxID=182803 RepID=A0A4Y2SU82_ARAVE|nr:hypothetical protein AVEN_83321-1 [Araneus ventricosus]GBN91204.1 hypothetical protein AVEN_115731-1 [Araneus ventricosus]